MGRVALVGSGDEAPKFATPIHIFADIGVIFHETDPHTPTHPAAGTAGNGKHRWNVSAGNRWILEETAFDSR